MVGLIANLVEKGELQFQTEWVDEAKLASIEEACARLGTRALKPLKDALAPDITYEEIRLGRGATSAAATKNRIDGYRRCHSWFMRVSALCSGSPEASLMSAPTIPAEKTHLTREEINRKQKEYIFPSVTNYFSDPLPMDRGAHAARLGRRGQESISTSLAAS